MKNINILIFPVADCDLQRFLNACQELNDDVDTTRIEAWQQVMAAAAVNLDSEMERSSQLRVNIPGELTDFLKRSMGCMVQALSWMHQQKIAHYDLKPANILLRNGEVYLTDFGLCRDRMDELNSYTEQDPGGTQGTRNYGTGSV